MRKIICGMILALLIVSVFPLAFNIQLVKAAGGTIYIRADGSVDPSSAPILNVGNVSYTFTADINESIVVERDNIVVDGAGYMLQGAGNESGISLAGRSNVTIKSITIREFVNGIWLSSSSYNNSVSANYITNNTYGILLDSSSYNSISANDITNNTYGIWLSSSSNNGISANDITNNTYYGIKLSSSSYNSISANNITNNNRGIWLYSSSYNSISANNITNNDYYGIKLHYYSNNNSISANNITNNGYGIYLYHYLYNNSISANNITNNNGYGIWLYYYSYNNGISANNITNNTYCGIWLYYYSSNNSVSANDIANNDWGIWLYYYSSNNSVSANNITNNNRGIWLYYYSNNNSVSANNITNNNGYGIELDYSSSNFICHNKFVDNTAQAIVTPGYVNIWDDGYPSGGNYWSDYTGADLYKGPNQNVAGSDGIGDTPYVIDADNRDNYPLMKPWTAITNVAILVIRKPNNLTNYRTYNATTDSWTSWKALPRTTCDSPAAAICNNELHMVIRDSTGNKLYHGYVNLANNVFSGWKLLSGSTPSAPTLTSNGTVLCLVIRGVDNRTRYRVYSFSPSRSWGSWKTLARATCDGAAAAMLGNNLHIVTRSLDGKSLWHIIIKPNVGVVRNWISVSGSTPSKPALTANQTANKLYLIVRGLNNRIRWRTYDGAADLWAGWSTVPTGTTCDGPAATALDNKLHIVIRSMTGTTLRHGYINLATNTFSGWTTLSGSTPSAPTLTS